MYKIGLSTEEVSIDALKSSGLTWEEVNPRERIVKIAPSLVGVPYKFGASVSKDSPNVFDCSSLTAYLYVQAGVAIPRVCDDQYHFGREVSAEEAKPSDLVFFRGNRTDISAEKVGHVGVYIGNGEMVQAGGVDIGYGKVVKERITDSKYYPTFLGYRSMLPNDESRYVIQIPDERPDLRNKENLLKELSNANHR